MNHDDPDTSAHDLQRTLAPVRHSVMTMPLSDEVRALVEQLRRALQMGPR